MGRPKALLSVGNKTFLEQIVSALKATKVGPILVVVGHHAEEIKAKAGKLPVTFVVNKNYARGQLSSLLAAISALEQDAGGGSLEAILVHLVDHPFISPSVVDLMIDRFYEAKKLIVIPTYKGKRGHPVLFSSRLFPELIKAPLDQGAKPVVRAHREDTLELETGDEGVVTDIDTPDEYRAQMEKLHVKA